MAYTVPFVFACHLRSADPDVVTAATWAREKPLIVVNPPPMYIVVPAAFARSAVTVPLARGCQGMTRPVLRLSAARWFLTTPPPPAPGARTRVKSPPMKIFPPAMAIARTRPFVCQELAGVDVKAFAVPGAIRAVIAAPTMNSRKRPAMVSAAQGSGPGGHVGTSVRDVDHVGRERAALVVLLPVAERRRRQLALDLLAADQVLDLGRREPGGRAEDVRVGDGVARLARVRRQVVEPQRGAHPVAVGVVLAHDGNADQVRVRGCIARLHEQVSVHGVLGQLDVAVLVDRRHPPGGEVPALLALPVQLSHHQQLAAVLDDRAHGRRHDGGMVEPEEVAGGRDHRRGIRLCALGHGQILHRPASRSTRGPDGPTTRATAPPGTRPGRRGTVPPRTRVPTLAEALRRRCIRPLPR